MRKKFYEIIWMGIIYSVELILLSYTFSELQEENFQVRLGSIEIAHNNSCLELFIIL